MNSLAETFSPKLIVKSWADSLKIFIPANFKLFALVTLKSFIDGLKVFFSGIFWTGLLWVVLGYSLQLFARSEFMQSVLKNEQALYYLVIAISLMNIIAMYIFQFGWFVSIRSSVDKKDRAYIKKYRWAFPVMFIIWTLFGFLFDFISAYINFSFLSPFIFSVFIVGAWITIFFFVESGRTIKEFFQSFWRMKLFFIFNFPGLAIFCCLYALIIGLDLKTESIPLAIIISLVSAIIPMIGVCALYNYFIKRFHDHSELYF